MSSSGGGVWSLIRRAINRAIAALVIAVAGWFGRRYGAAAVLVSLLLGLVLLAGRYLGEWGATVGRALLLVVPVYLVVVPLIISLFLVRAVAIEPSKLASRLEWDEEEMEPEPEVVEGEVLGSEVAVFEQYQDRNRESA